jgi:hypothetical protein
MTKQSKSPKNDIKELAADLDKTVSEFEAKTGINLTTGSDEEALRSIEVQMGPAAGLVPQRPKPSVGRIVHFASPAVPEPKAAVITAVHDDGVVDLDVHLGHGVLTFADQVRQGDPGDPQRRWFWPPQV